MKIAVVGAGISGLYVAYQLGHYHDVTVFDKNDYLGGHTATKIVRVNSGEYAIDTGFIVCNDKTYPNFLALMDALSVGYKPTEMSFAVSCADTGLEYNGTTLNRLFAQRRNLIRPKFWRMASEILRFNRLAKNHLSLGNVDLNDTLGGFLKRHQFEGWVVSHYLAPMTAAIWSTALHDVLNFPLAFFLQFCDNHGLLNINDRPQWYTIQGGSHEYVKALVARSKARFEVNTHITAITRTNQHIEVRKDSGAVQNFDRIVLACHSDEALALLTDASKEEQSILTAIPYEESDVILHTDTRLLPKRKLAHAAWNYLLSAKDKLPTLTDHMNILQRIESPETFCVTLNRKDAIKPEKILGRYRYAHPQFTPQAVTAQKRHHEISGERGTYFAGAYWFNGFHEDGVVSAQRVVQQLRP